eukprot:TRINITY_DN3591_c1_g1_i9.p1 TRINITY_DN3591_c1_g1~~TRINITY_DN3591_c1_g1_i9.p1  ORF type:complete len:145 (+),score=4.89 TRINITY_DN3591_c1_g1_i9:296-730(+)
MCCFQIYSFLYKNESDPFQTLSFHQFVPSPEFVDGTLVTINKLFSLLVTSILTAALTSDFSLMIGLSFKLVVTSVIGNLFNTVTLLWLGVNFLFVWPRLYERKRTQFDKLYHSIYLFLESVMTTAAVFLPSRGTTAGNNTHHKK